MADIARESGTGAGDACTTGADVTNTADIVLQELIRCTPLLALVPPLSLHDLVWDPPLPAQAQWSLLAYCDVKSSSCAGMLKTRAKRNATTERRCSSLHLLLSLSGYGSFVILGLLLEIISSLASKCVFSCIWEYKLCIISFSLLKCKCRRWSIMSRNNPDITSVYRCCFMILDRLAPIKNEPISILLI